MTTSLRYFFMHLPTKLREEDKRLHMAWSFWMMLTFSIIWPSPWSFVTVLLLGLAKEFWDRRFGSGFCFFDLAANLLGSAFALLLVDTLPGSIFD